MSEVVVMMDTWDEEIWHEARLFVSDEKLRNTRKVKLRGSEIVAKSSNEMAKVYVDIDDSKGLFANVDIKWRNWVFH